MAVKPKPGTRRTTPASARSKANEGSLSLVPDMSNYDSYIGRHIVFDPNDPKASKTEFEVFDYARKTKRNVLIEGPTGPGKTKAVIAYAAREEMPFYSIPSNIGIEPSQLFGKFIPTAEGTIKWVDGPVTAICRTGGVLLINEVNFVPERVGTVLFSLLDARRQITLLDHEAETIDAADDLLIIADMNPDYEGTRPLNKAFRNRFAIQLHWDYDDSVESKLVKSVNLRDMAGKLRKEQKAGTYDTPCSTNMLMEFEEIFTAMGFDFAAMNFVNHFSGDERQAVAVVAETYKAGIIQDLSPAGRRRRGKATDPLAAERAKLEAEVDPNRNQYVEERVDADGNKEVVLVDPEWGTLGVEWVYDDDDEDTEDDE